MSCMNGTKAIIKQGEVNSLRDGRTMQGVWRGLSKDLESDYGNILLH